MNDCSTKGNAPEVAATEASSEANPIEKESIMSDCTEVAPVRAITVPFHGAELVVVEHNGQPYTPMKTIVEGMGLDWGGQHKKALANQSRWGISVMEIPSAGGSQLATCILLRKLPAWLATIDPGRVKKLEARARVIQYQDECDEVLWQYWNDGVAVNPRALYSVNPGDVLTKEEADTLRQLIESTAKKLAGDSKMQGKFILQAWSKLKSHFKVGYREIPRHELTEAISIINRHTVEWEVVDDEPRQDGIALNSDRLDQAFQLASQAAAQVQRAVFNCVMEGKEPISLSNHWELYFHQKNWGDKATDAYCKPLAPDAICMGPDEYLTSLESGEGHILSMERLARMAALSSKKIADRFRQQASVANGVITKAGRHDVLTAR